MVWDHAGGDGADGNAVSHTEFKCAADALTRHAVNGLDHGDVWVILIDEVGEASAIDLIACDGGVIN